MILIGPHIRGTSTPSSMRPSALASKVGRIGTLEVGQAEPNGQGSVPSEGVILAIRRVLEVSGIEPTDGVTTAVRHSGGRA